MGGYNQAGAYHTYLVRLWQSEPEAPWRASARDVQSGQERAFASVERLLVFLSDRTRHIQEPEPLPTTPSSGEQP